MVGDDVRTDVRAAQRAGLRGILVLSGKHGAADVEAAARARRSTPDAMARDLAQWSRRSTDEEEHRCSEPTFTRRPVWSESCCGAGFSAAGQLLISGWLVAGAGWSGPVVTLLAPAAVAVLAALVIRAGWGAVGYAIGQVVAAQVGPLMMASMAVPQTIDLVLSLAAGLVGYAVRCRHPLGSIDARVRPPVAGRPRPRRG